MKVIIPLAGKGTRLRPHTYITPKPLLKVADKPVMSYILDDLRELGVEEVVFITGYLKEKIEDYIRAEYPEFRAHFVEQPVQNGTAAAVQLAEPFIDEDVLIIFVDTLFDADLGVVRSLPEGDAGVIWVKEVEDYRRFGVVVTDREGYMKRIVEKPRDPISKLANIGLYYIRDWRLLFEGIRHTMGGPKAPGEEYYLTDAFQYMIDRGARLRTIEVQGWYDCGKPETLISTNLHLLEAGRARKPDGGDGVRIQGPVRVAEGVELEDVVLGPNVTIGTGCKLRGVRIRDSIVGSHTTIEDSEIHDSLIGDRVRVRGVKGTLNVADDSEVLGG